MLGGVTSECGEYGENVLGRGTIERVKGVIVWLAWLVFAGSNKSVTKIKQHKKTSFVKITCQYSDVCLLGVIDSCLQTYVSHCSCNSFRIIRTSVPCSCRLKRCAVVVRGHQRPS